MENPKQKWMIWGYPHDLGHFYIRLGVAARCGLAQGVGPSVSGNVFGASKV